MRTTTSRIQVGAPCERVWDVLTDPHHVKQWQYGSDLETDWTVGSPIRFVSQWEGQRFEQWGSVLQFDPPSRVAYSLFAPRPDLEDLPENYFTMIYTLDPVDGGTELAIIREDPRPLPPGAPPPDDGEAPRSEDDPVLLALKSLAES